jgi:dimethylhistidine N-methyltransferase
LASRSAALPLPPAPGDLRRQGERERFRKDVLAGLVARPRAIPSVWFYDERGTLLFQRIADLDEYYLTRCEREILDRHGDRIVAPLHGRRCMVADLGAGDGAKTRLLLSRLARRSPDVTYAPVDVSASALADACAHASRALPRLRLVPVAAEYSEGLRRMHSRPREDVLLALLLGSNIGNLERPAALRLLREVRAALRPGDHLLVGLDLLKDPEVLRRAYDDRAGVTAAFNLNLLLRMNRELGADFDPSAFEHRATLDPVRPAMESWLVSRRRQTVRVAGRAFALAAGEPIHTEISCKYREEDVTAFAGEAGFEEVGRYRDRRGWFLDALWRVPLRGRPAASGGRSC